MRWDPFTDSRLMTHNPRLLLTRARDVTEYVDVLQRIPVLNEADVCCLVDPGALDPEVRSLGDHLALSRDLLIALADPMRQDLVQLLARAELNVGEIAERVTLSRPTVSHHLNILRRAGLVRVRKQGREMYYRLNKERIVGTLQGLLDSLTCC
jgi:ArsR family transcriptional regulator